MEARRQSFSSQASLWCLHIPVQKQMAKARKVKSFPFLKWPMGEELLVGGTCTRVIFLASWHRNYITTDPLPREAEIPSAIYGNCLVYLLSIYLTQGEDAWLLKGPEWNDEVAVPLSRSPSSNRILFRLLTSDMWFLCKKVDKCIREWPQGTYTESFKGIEVYMLFDYSMFLIGWIHWALYISTFWEGLLSESDKNKAEGGMAHNKLPILSSLYVESNQQRVPERKVTGT